MTASSDKADLGQAAGLPKWFLFVTVGLCGGLVMVIEVLGSRVIGPFYGVSLFVWTSLITVTLVALAIGYAAGGVLADRLGRSTRSTDALYGAIGLAGVAALVVPAVQGPVLMACQPLGLRSGALLGSAVLFGPSLVLLGCVSPWVVKVAARDLSNVGRVVGFFTALSTIGSFLGTVLTGFVLIGLLGVSKIFMLVGALLIALAVTYHVVFRRRLVAAAALLLPFVPLTSPQPTSVMRASGTKAEMVHSVETFYGSIKVIEYSKGVHHTRELAIDGLVQGGIDVRTGASIYGYAYLLGALPRSVQPKGEDALVIGLGAGLVPNWLGQHGVRTDVVDIDPEIARVAQDWFGFKPTGEIIIQDARAFLTRSNQSYDYIVLDVFNGDTTPGHLLSVEALRLVDAHLDDGGVMATNVMGCLGERQSMMGSVVLTMREVFDTVVAYPMFDPQQDMPCGNLILIAYDGSPVDANVGFDELQRMPPGAKNQVVTALQRKTVPPTDPNAFVLTDDYNPIDLYDLDLKEWVRAGIQNETDWEFLL